MEQMHDARGMDADNTRQADLLKRQIASRAYRVITGEDQTSQPVVVSDAVLIYTAANRYRSFVDEPMLPIVEFSK